MKILGVLVLVAAASLLLAPDVDARMGRRFLPGSVSLAAGSYLPEGSDLDEQDADSGFSGFLALGYMASPFVGMQFDFGYLTSSGSNDLKISAVPMVVSAKVALPVYFVEPYLLAGGGIYYTNAVLDLPGGGSIDDKEVRFAPHAAGGVNLNFGEAQLGVEARYLWLHTAGLDVDGLMVMGKIGTRF